MCGIFAATSLSKLQELAKLNSGRGNIAHSITGFAKDRNGKAWVNLSLRGIGRIEPTLRHLLQIERTHEYKGAHRGINDIAPQLVEHDKTRYQSSFYIGHILAPTGTERQHSAALNTTHPAEFKDELLWHNGLLIDGEVEKLENSEDYRYDKYRDWDTFRMLLEINKRGITKAVENFNGSFACIHFKDGMMSIFRNNLAPMYADDNGSLSSIEFKNSTAMQAGVVYRSSLTDTELHIAGKWKLGEGLYYGV